MQRDFDDNKMHPVQYSSMNTTEAEREYTGQAHE